MRWVRGGGALAIFPAGEVSRLEIGARKVTDAPWSDVASRIALAANAPVVPMFFDGRNSMTFQLAGLIHPRLRTALLPRELIKRHGTRMQVQIGSIITPARLAKLATPAEMTRYLRVRTMILKARVDRLQKHDVLMAAAPKMPVIDRIDPSVLDREIAALDAASRLASSADLDVFVAAASQIPQTIREIGRLREITFRAAGEGTGRDIDLDLFDDHYDHLFVWSRTRREVVGSYRIGFTDQILPTHGPDGLYTHSLFRFRDRLLKQLTPGIELGRSFVRVEYQKEFAPLLLLWKGIGQIVARQPHYRMLFGPVSISNEYSSLTRQILMAFLRINNHLPSLGKLLSPKNPPRLAPARDLPELTEATSTVGSIDSIDELIAEIESDRRGVPVLLRQYLKLGAKLLAFNIDPAFGDVLDGLMLVDLAKVDRTILTRYMGRENAAQYLSYWKS
jgi:putative hemolysin